MNHASRPMRPTTRKKTPSPVHRAPVRRHVPAPPRSAGGLPSGKKPEHSDGNLAKLLELVTESVCGYPNVWGVFWQPIEGNAEVVVVATPPVTRLVQYMLDGIAERLRDTVAKGWRLRCSTIIPDGPYYKCAYRRFA